MDTIYIGIYERNVVTTTGGHRSSDGFVYTENHITETKIFISNKVEIPLIVATRIRQYLSQHPTSKFTEKCYSIEPPIENIEYLNSETSKFCCAINDVPLIPFDFLACENSDYSDANTIISKRFSDYHTFWIKPWIDVQTSQVNNIKQLVEHNLFLPNVIVEEFTFIASPLLRIKRGWEFVSLYNIYLLDIAVNLESADLISYLLDSGANLSCDYQKLLKFSYDFLYLNNNKLHHRVFRICMPHIEVFNRVITIDEIKKYIDDTMSKDAFISDFELCPYKLPSILEIQDLENIWNDLVDIYEDITQEEILKIFDKRTELIQKRIFSVALDWWIRLWVANLATNDTIIGLALSSFVLIYNSGSTIEVRKSHYNYGIDLTPEFLFKLINNIKNIL